MTLGLYARALGEPGTPLRLRAEDGSVVVLDVARWCAAPDLADESVLGRCRGPVLDVGCGPGRLTAALAARRVPALGVDISGTAVARTLAAGGPALRRSVFDRLPGEGRWATVLLIDGNVGIGGDPAALLARCARLLRPGGALIVEVEPAEIDQRVTVRLEDAVGRRGPAFRWARAGAGAVTRLAAAAGLGVDEGWTSGARSFLSLRP